MCTDHTHCGLFLRILGVLWFTFDINPMSLPTFGLLFLCFASLGASEKYTNDLVLGNGTYNVSWAFNNETDKFYFKVRAKAVGWVGFGVTKLDNPPDPNDNWVKTGMDSLDIVVGGVFLNSSKYYYGDYHTGKNGYKFPIKDQKQNWEQKSAEQADGFTTLEYERLKDTGDVEGDNEIKPGYMFLVWAYHNSSDEFVNASNKHTASGLSELLQLIPEVREPAVRITRAPPGESAGASSILIGNLFLVLLALIFLY